MANLPEKARLAAEKHHMFDRGSLVVAAVSGGPDSVAMLHWLAGLARETGFGVHVAHLDHMLRGAESGEDARWVERFSAGLGLPSTIEAEDVSALRKALRLSLEDAARLARYSFFARVVKRLNADGVAVAHTSDDQVETVVLHWLRGAGLAGLRGMQPVMQYRVKPFVGRPAADLKVARPLLDVWRSELEEYLRENNLTSRADRTNLDPVFLRNKVRRQLIPYLQSYNPRFRESVLRASRILSCDYDFIQAKVSETWSYVARVEGQKIVFDSARWHSLHEALQRHLLREAASRLVGDVVGLGAVHIESALGAIGTGRTGVEISWPRGLVVKKGYDSFWVALRAESPQPGLRVEGQRLEIPGRTRLLGTPWEVEASVSSCPCPGAGQPMLAVLDLSKTGRELVVRRRRSGDRFRPLGLGGEKSLQDFFVDAKVPAEDRDNVPIVSSPDHVVWVVGLRVDDRAKVSSSTREYLCLKFLETDGSGDTTDE